MPRHKFPAENIKPIDEKLTASIAALSEVVNYSEVGLMNSSGGDDAEWYQKIKERSNKLLAGVLALRADIWAKGEMKKGCPIAGHHHTCDCDGAGGGR